MSSAGGVSPPGLVVGVPLGGAVGELVPLPDVGVPGAVVAPGGVVPGSVTVGAAVPGSVLDGVGAPGSVTVTVEPEPAWVGPDSGPQATSARDSPAATARVAVVRAACLVPRRAAVMDALSSSVVP
jgi:hypothetical protein